MRPLSQLEQMQLNIAARFVAGPLIGKVSLAPARCGLRMLQAVQEHSARQQ